MSECEAALCETCRIKIKARVESRAPDEAVFRVYFIEVVNDSADNSALIVVQRMFKHSASHGSGVEHQILADNTVRICQSVGEPPGFGHQQ